MDRSDRIESPLESLPELAAIADDVLLLSSRVGSLGLRTGDVKHDAGERAKYMAISFASKQEEHLRSLRRLVSAGQHRDAFLIARTMIEGIVQLRWALDNQPDGPDLWFWYCAIEDWRQLNRNRDDGVDIDPGVETISRKLLDEHGEKYYTDKATKKSESGKPLTADPYRRKWNDLDAASMFNAVEWRALYETVYRSASNWMHWNPRSMMLAAGSDGNLQTQSSEDPSRAAQALAAGVFSHMQLLALIDSLFFIGWKDDLDTLHERMRAVIRLDYP